MRISRMGQISLVVIAVGTALLVYYIHSLAPRRADVVLDIPVSLSPGHIRTGDVRVALDTMYYAYIELHTAYSKRVGCDPYDVLATRWTLSDGEHVVEQGSSPWEDTGLTIGGLYSEKPLYSMDIEVLPRCGLPRGCPSATQNTALPIFQPGKRVAGLAAPVAPRNGNYSTDSPLASID